jgi:hypothetical protein
MQQANDRRSLMVCLASVLEMDRPVQAVSEARRGGERWSFRCLRSIEQWKVTPEEGRGFVFGHNTGWKWKFYDSGSHTHIMVSRKDGVYRIWDYSALDPVEVTFMKRTATLHEPAKGTRTTYQVEV